MDLELTILAGGAAIALGTLLSAVYYFARYYIKTDDEKAAELNKVELDSTAASGAPESLTSPNLNQVLKETRSGFWGKIQSRLSSSSQMGTAELEAIEEILYSSDMGTQTATRLLDCIQDQHQGGESFSIDQLKTLLRSKTEDLLKVVPRMGESPFEKNGIGSKPQVWMIVGVNGVGKTTTIGKLAHVAASRGLKVLVAAGDTFRAAAQAQLKVWTDRAAVEIFAPEGVKDPGAVAFDAVQMAKARGYDLVLIDTAGRLHTQDHLMEELKKAKRVIQKIDDKAPHETLIVLDANSGQNALVQAQRFHEALGLTGAIFTKMDGSAKGGVVLGLATQLQIPTLLLGVGETVDSLKAFDPLDYSRALFDSNPV